MTTAAMQKRTLEQQESAKITQKREELIGAAMTNIKQIWNGLGIKGETKIQECWVGPGKFNATKAEEQLLKLSEEIDNNKATDEKVSLGAFALMQLHFLDDNTEAAQRIAEKLGEQPKLDIARFEIVMFKQDKIPNGKSIASLRRAFSHETGASPEMLNAFARTE